MLPCESAASPDGKLKLASVAGPPFPPVQQLPFPAKVLMYPTGELIRLMRRSRRLYPSATRRSPFLSMASALTPHRRDVVASAPSPANSQVVTLTWGSPAIVVMMPVLRLTLRIRLPRAGSQEMSHSAM